jgi:hypothetical protein
MSAYLTKGLSEKEIIEIDFSGIKVLTPSWADEVITKIKKSSKKSNFSVLITQRSRQLSKLCKIFFLIAKVFSKENIYPVVFDNRSQSRA